MRGDTQPSGRALIASFAAVAVIFTLGIAVAQVFNLRIRSAAREITSSSSPSISRLSSMRSTIRVLQVLVDDFVDECVLGPCSPAPPSRIHDLRRALVLDWAEYRALPTFPGEAQRWPEVEDAITHLDEELTLAFAALARGRRKEAEAANNRGVKPASDRLDEAVAGLIQLDHDQGLVVASQIDGFARLSLTASVLLDLVSVALTIVAAALGIRVVRRYEQSLRNRAEELDQFAGRVAHDVMSPLASTAAALHVARQEASERGKAAIERGQRGLQRVQMLVDGLLEFARAGAAHRPSASTAVQGVLDDVLDELRPVAHENRVALRVESPAAPEKVSCSPGVLTSIVSNLVRNAIVHMGSSAVREVRIRAQPIEAARRLRIEVEDTGPGIPPALGERVFEPFVRGPGMEHHGSGLGLATAKRMVIAHGGRIGFRSERGSGTLFWLELPQPPLP